ncbi:MAG: sensor histidine kinase [Hamadaea sp.]|uniref:sensor histidine kinase n=1 Tax=Hamadaea sp. TaxID=2024425 RepID=UPI00185440AE|nr:sensor domain-containing protein [Hamadaea sp.]NUR51034.1 sensor histidine kinase [Hamadaea sp.]NUR70691.1 sensor histidine kinase [Hamadaea sp.]NUT17878.1 sensor histidine kinase [Hamadaea sp.]
MQTRTAWQAIAQRPLRFLTSSWPWRSLAYLVTGVAVGVVTGLLMIGLAAAGVLLLIVVVGIGVLVVTALAGIYVARFERWRLRLVDLDRAADPHRKPSAPGLRAWLTTRLREQATWREFSFVVIWLGGLWFVDLGVLALTLWLPFYFMSVPIADPNTWPWMVIGIAMLLPAPYTITAWAGARAALTRALLAPRDDELGVRLDEVTRSRARLVDAFESERRRIERDLHDGAQQRLVSLSVQLGLARLDVAPDSAVANQLAAAQEQVTLVLSELRDLVRGVHPQVLTDHGLAAAIEEIADRAPIPVTVDIRLPGRVAGVVELTAYFVIAEALVNVAKHASASHASVRGRLEPDLLVIEVRDDGVGGADPSAGSGLTGLADRVAVVDGRVRLSSPPGGPTLLHVEIPCHSV